MWLTVFSLFEFNFGFIAYHRVAFFSRSFVFVQLFLGKRAFCRLISLRFVISISVQMYTSVCIQFVIFRGIVQINYRFLTVTLLRSESYNLI